MLQEQKTNTNLGIGFGLLLLSVARFFSNGTFSPLTTLAITLVGLALYFWGCISYARGKGHSAAWGFVALIPFIGLIILVALSDRYQQSVQTVGRGRAYWLFALLLGLFGLVGWHAYRTPHPKSVAEMQTEAVKRYPQLAIPNSPINHEFVTRYKRYQATNKDYFKNAEWPLTLAAECQSAIAPPSTGK